MRDYHILWAFPLFSLICSTVCLVPPYFLDIVDLEFSITGIITHVVISAIETFIIYYIAKIL